MAPLGCYSLLWLLLCVAKVFGGAVFEEVKPVLSSAQDFKVIFTTITPPNNPAIIRAGQTAFNRTAIQMRRVTIEPCGVIAAHIHPRGTEWGYVIEGSFEFGMFLENGTNLGVVYTAGEGVVIPQGTVHFARNTGCTKAEIVVIFDHPDPAVVYVGEALSSMPINYLDSAFSGNAASGLRTTGNQFRDRNCKCG